MRACLLSVVLCCAAQADSGLVLRNVTVVDIAHGALKPGQTILIQNGKKTQAIDATGKYAIPGLWDMHVHLWYPENQFSLFLVRGVTGIRDMGSDLNRTRAWQRAIAAGELLGPEIVTSGPPIDGVASDDSKLPVLSARTPVEAREAVAQLAAVQVDFVKVLSSLSRDAYLAAAEETRRRGLTFSGHVPDSVTAEQAISAGQKSMEHLFGVVESCSRESVQVRAALADATRKHDGEAVA